MARRQCQRNFENTKELYRQPEIRRHLQVYYKFIITNLQTITNFQIIHLLYSIIYLFAFTFLINIIQIRIKIKIAKLTENSTYNSLPKFTTFQRPARQFSSLFPMVHSSDPGIIM